MVALVDLLVCLNSLKNQTHRLLLQPLVSQSKKLHGYHIQTTHKEDQYFKSPFISLLSFKFIVACSLMPLRSGSRIGDTEHVLTFNVGLVMYDSTLYCYHFLCHRAYTYSNTLNPRFHDCARSACQPCLAIAHLFIETS